MPPRAAAAVADVTPSDEAAQALTRQQPIPPPSEPKQYRAIGLVRGRYVPSEEQFTRGTMTTADGAAIEAVLLGRVMSLVKNHLDLQEDHLWVVYPRTRETQEDLHVQIVGVWEPEKLSKNEKSPDAPEDAADSDSEESAESSASLPSEDLSPGYEDDYFSIRGEVVFYAPEQESVVVKIQQAPRKGTTRAKAFKLQLKGSLPSEKTLGYFWDLHIQRIMADLVITQGNVIGLVPPKKKPQGAGATRRPDRKPFKKRPSGPPNRGPRPNSGNSGPPVRREALPKPSKRIDPSSSES